MTQTERQYRPGLPTPPRRMRGRPVLRGYPIPFFVAEIDGTYDFRVADPHKRVEALRYGLCWVCGQRLGAYKSFVIGPMCGVNRTTAEPPCHTECATWSALACPFLNQQMSHRREGGLIGTTKAPAGEMIERQPGVTLVWTTKRFSLFSDGTGGALIRLGDPVTTAWYAHGRPATREEVLASIESGLPALREVAEEDGEAALAELDRYVERAMRYVPR